MNLSHVLYLTYIIIGLAYNRINVTSIFSTSLLVSSCKGYNFSILGLLYNNYKLILSGITILISVSSVLLLIAANVYDNPIYTLLVLISALIALYSLTFHFNDFKEQYPVFTSILLVTLFLIVLMTSCMLVGQLLSILYRLFMNQGGPSNNTGGGNGGGTSGGGSSGPRPRPGPGGQGPYNKVYRRATREEKNKSDTFQSKGKRVYKSITNTDSPVHTQLLEYNKTALIEVADSYEKHRLSMASSGVRIQDTKSEWIEAAKSYKQEREAGSASVDLLLSFFSED